MSVEEVTGYALARLSGGAARAEVRRLCGDPHNARVVWVAFAAEDDPVPLGASTSAQFEMAARTARTQRLPLVGVLSTAGADINEGISALHGMGRIAAELSACSGLVPTVLIVNGPAVAGPALALGIADIVIMTESSRAFVNGPIMVEQFTGVEIDQDELGGAANLARYTGVPTLVVGDLAEAEEAAAEILSYLAPDVDSMPVAHSVEDPVDRLCPEAGELIPASSTGSYDVRKVAEAIVDADSLLELRDRWATNVVTALATVGGQPIGIVANQPLSLAGTLDIPASQKAARFVALCDAFNVPLLTLVDTPGFYPGKDLEWRGMIRHGAQLVYAYARASVPRICVILRKSYGGAYIVMDSKTMGNDLCLAWPWAEIAVMGAGQAAAILARRADEAERAAFEADYAERLLNPYVAAERGYIDAVIDPADTRRHVAEALFALADKREVLGPRKHGNSPL